MSGTSTSLAAALEKNFFAPVKALDFDALQISTVDEYQRQVRATVQSSFSEGKICNEIYVDLLKVLQQFRSLDKTKLSAPQLTSMCASIQKLGTETAKFRECGTLSDSAHLEIHLLLIIKSLDPVFPRHVDAVSNLYEFVREILRRRYQNGIGGVMEKLESYTDHIFSLTYNKGLNESKSRPKDKAWAYISCEALKLAPYSMKLLESDISERVFVRFNAFKTGALSKTAPDLERCFYSSMIEEFLIAGSALPKDIPEDDDATRRYKLLIYLTAFSLSLQYMVECRSAKIVGLDASSMRKTLSAIRLALAEFDQPLGDKQIIDDSFDCAFWVLNGANFSALPPGLFRKTSNPLLGEIQFYAHQSVPQCLAQLLDLDTADNSSLPNPSLPNPELSSYLAASWRSCFIPCKSSSYRLVHEIPMAFNCQLKSRFYLMKDEIDLPSMRCLIAEIDAWQKQHKLAATLAAQPNFFLDHVGLIVQKHGNAEFIATNYAKSIRLYELCLELYLHQHEDVKEARSQTVYGQDSRLWPAHEFLARAYELLHQREKCIDNLVRGIGLVKDATVFNSALVKATSFCAKLEDWAGPGLCEKLFASKPSGFSFPMDRFAMLTTELNGWKSSKRNSMEQQKAALKLMRKLSGLSKDQSIWLDVEMVNVEHATSGANRTEEEQNRFILELNRIVSEGKRVSEPSANYKFCLAKSYFLLHVITTTKLADSIQEKQKAQEAANKSPSTLPSAENPEGEESAGGESDSCTNFVTVSLQKRTYENLEKCFILLKEGEFHKTPSFASYSIEYLNLVTVMTAYWELGSCPDRVLDSLLLGLKCSRAFSLRDQATKFAAKIALLLCRQEMVDVAGAFILGMESSTLAASLAKCQYFALARAWHAFGVRDHAKSAAIFASLSEKPRNLDRNVLIELLLLRAAQLLVPGSQSPYVKDAQTWETPQALLQFGMRLAESIAGQVGKSGGSGGGFKEMSFVEMSVLHLRVFSDYCAICDSCEWIRESGFLYREAFQMAERFGVPHWMAKIMLQRVDRDVLMEAKNEAEARLREVKFVLNSPGDAFLAHLKLTGVLARKPLLQDVSIGSSGDDDDEESFALPKVPQAVHHRHHPDGDSSPTSFAQKTSSPIFKRTASAVPAFVSHLPNCSCPSCDDLAYQECLFDLMFQHGALLLKQESSAQTVFAADAGLKIHAKMVETWKRKRSAWRTEILKSTPKIQIESEENDENPFIDRLWKMRNLKAEAHLSLGKTGPCQAALKALIDGVEETASSSSPFHSSKWSRISTTTLGTTHYLYLVSLGNSLLSEEKMMAPDWVVMKMPNKSDLPSSNTADLPMDFDEMLNLGEGISFRKPSSSTQRRHDSENIPPKKSVKSECLTPNLFPFNSASKPSSSATLKEAQNTKPSFSIYSDSNVDNEGLDSVFDTKPVIKSESSITNSAPCAGKAPKRRVAKSRTARVNLHEPEPLGSAAAATPKSTVKKQPIFSATDFAQAAIASSSGAISQSPYANFKTALTTPSEAPPASKSTTITKARNKKEIPAIVFEMPSSSDESPPAVRKGSGRSGPSGDGGDEGIIDSKTVTKTRGKTTTKKAPAVSKFSSFVSSPEVSPAPKPPPRKRAPPRKIAGAAVKGSTPMLSALTPPPAMTTVKKTTKVSPRRKLEDDAVDAAADATASKRKCSSRRKVLPISSPDLNAVTKEIGVLNLSSDDSESRKAASKSRKATFDAGDKDSKVPFKRAAPTRKKRAPQPHAALDALETARDEEENDEKLDASALNLDDSVSSSASSSSTTTTSAIESERDRFSVDDNVFVSDLRSDEDLMDAEVIRKDSPNSQLRPKMKMMPGDMVDALAGEGNHGHIGVEEFTLKRAKSLMETAVDLMSVFPMGYAYRQCVERLALLSGCEDSVICGGNALQSTGLSFRHLSILNACKFLIRLHYRYQETVPVFCNSVVELLSFRMSPQQVVSRISEYMPPTWKLAQLRVIPASPTLPSVISKPTSSSLLLVTLYSSSSLLSNVLLPFNSAILDQYAKQLSANLDSIKKGHDDLVSYWEKRESEDRNMGKFLASAERDLLGPWVGLLMGEVRQKADGEGLDWASLTTQALELLPELSQSLLDASDGSLLSVLMQAYLKGFSKLTPSLRCEGIQQLVGKSMPILEAHAVVKKIDRLLDQTVGPNGAKYKKILENLEPVVIVLDGHLQSLPVERFPSFEVNSSMTRLPSALFLPVLIKHSATHAQGGVDANKGWYLIDPASNLEGTQTRMRDWVKQAFPQWNGVIGKEPDAADALKQVRSLDVYMYCGHGSGAVFIGKDDVQRDVLRAICLLVGCSGGLLVSLGGNLEPWGRVIPFIIGCAPAVVSPLWEVTDRDIDIFTQDMLEYWLKITSPSARISLAKVMNKAASKLKCKFANGRSVVTYGIPIYRRK